MLPILLIHSCFSIRTVQADPFGGATVDIYDEINVGQISFQPLRLM